MADKEGETMPEPEFIPGANFSNPKPIILASESMLSKDALSAATTEHKKKNPTNLDNDLVKFPLPKPPQQMVLWGANLGTDGCPTQWSAEFAKYLCDMSSAQAIVPILIATKGVYGRQTGGMAPAALTDASGIALWGMVRSARQELPKIPMLLMDYPYGSTSAEISRCLQPADGEAIYYHDVKFLPKMEAVDSLLRRDVRRDGGGKPTGPKFTRKAFRWGGPTHKLDNCWYRQSWAIAGAGRVGLSE
mmetsp:Transcript_11478/g.26012  ORF Transcript_11478/g.26012 Transcript_11478/m.26012 type:complete len:247 (-) Transcript_11478:97-837(-)